jgi:hypothetical protein
MVLAGAERPKHEIVTPLKSESDQTAKRAPKTAPIFKKVQFTFEGFKVRVLEKLGSGTNKSTNNLTVFIVLTAFHGV